MTPPLLTIANVTQSFEGTRALDGVSFDIGRGEIVALMGANGAGKSTLVKILSGVLLADGGTITLDGKAFRPRSPAEAGRAGIATVHQSTDVVGIPGLTVADALMLGRFADRNSPFFLSRKTVRRQAQAMLDTVGIALPLERDFADLPAADRQLLAIARALSAHPQAEPPHLLILDEPTASLSAAESRRLFTILLRLRQDGLAVLYISHRTADLAALADRAIVLRNGAVAGAFARPIDFSRAIETMIGRPLAPPSAGLVRPRGVAVLEARQLRLGPDAAPFDLTVHAGEVVAVTGVLGGGKSRLLSTLFGVHPLHTGTIHLDGRSYRPRSPAQAIAAGVVMAGEDRHRSSLMPPDWPGHTLQSTISLPHLAAWSYAGFLFGGRERREAETAMARLSIKASGPDASIWSLSGGNQQKAVLARWDAAPCRLLMLDEPFQGVDVGARAEIIAAIRARTDRATLIATSDREEAEAVADRILVLDQHSLLADDHPHPADLQGTPAPLPEGRPHDRAH
ncbi:monosaccharide ABC transporter ATP-binding protein (CUT2 family) [Rhizobium sp. PP-F2F-G48]|uniref:sugar ABC transporter ATP-binding protein n=1 Tax=Rhizobium sp. PP-F2F-G48 TaxID=2135651 RepID=UPI001048AE24|nr:sugar ABC transporter ATP-binding protein [Rhizobium sp. PP-F2F-G48]TCM52808.1 monosaccharide ABC transporter ATP-binding protein (CUT2 family) [Rhizobium sp. PP-F2F-G48]